MPQICLILTAIASSCGQNKLNTFSSWEVFGNFKKRKKYLKRFSQFGYLNFSNSESQKRRQKCLCKYNNNNELNFRSKLSRQELVKNIFFEIGFLLKWEICKPEVLSQSFRTWFNRKVNTEKKILNGQTLRAKMTLSNEVSKYLGQF